MADNQYYMVVTDLGLSLIEDAYNSGTKVNLVAMALGDSNGIYVQPDTSFTSLVNEFGRVDIHEGNSDEYLINVISYVGLPHAGETVREFGLYDDNDNLIAYGAYPESLVPDVDSSEYIQIEIEARIDLTNASAVTITVNPIYAYATEDEAGIAKIIKEEDVSDDTEDTKILTIKKLLKRTASTSRAGVVKLSSATDSNSEETAATSKALATQKHDAGDITSGTLSNDRLNKASTSKQGIVQTTTSLGSTRTDLAAAASSAKALNDKIDGIISGFSSGQTWKSTSGKVFNVNYTNSNPYPIQIYVSGRRQGSTGGTAFLIVDGVMVGWHNATSVSAAMTNEIFSAIIPPGSVYQVQTPNSDWSKTAWAELY